MENYLTQIANYLLTQSWQIAILVVVIATASWLLKNKSAHIRYLLWLIVLAKCLVPPLVTVPLAILPQESLVEPVPILPRQMPARAGETVRMAPAEPSISDSYPVAKEKTPRFTIRQWLGIGWIIGVGVFVLVALVKALQTNIWLRRQRKPLPGEMHAKIEELFSKLDIRTLPNAWLIDGIGQPFVWGLLRGSIYLPADFVKVNNAEYRKGILGHELSHILRFDAAINLLQVIAQAIFWFHPFVWWANKKIRAEREKCCDEMAIARLGAKAKEYSSAIVNILISEHERVRPVPSLAVAGPVKNIEERIKTMLRPGKKFYKRPSLIVVTVVLVLALLTVPTALVLTARAETEATSEEPQVKPTKSLHQAAADGDIEQVKSLISKGADVNAKDEDGQVPLHLAARHGNKAVVELLLDRGAVVNVNKKLVPPLPGAAPLHEAVRYGHKDVAEVLIASGADVNALTKPGDTVLYCAAASGHEELAKLLIANGADVDAALHCVVGHGHLDAAMFLLSKGDNINAKDEKGKTALHKAARFGHKDVAELLVARGANVNAKDKEGITPTYAATTFLGVGQQQMVDVVKLLLAKGGQVDTVHLSAFVGDVDKVKGFLEQGIEVDAKDMYGRTPLHLASMSGQRDVLAFLIGKGADVNAKSRPGSDLALDLTPGVTPLDLAVTYSDYEVVKLLIDSGAEVNPKANTPFDVPPLWVAAMGAGLRIERMYWDAEAKLDMKEMDAVLVSLMQTLWPKRRDIFELLLTRGANVNQKGFMGATMLHLAASVGLKDGAELLIAHRADINAKDNQGRTPLHLVFDEDWSGIDIDKDGTVKLLIDKGSDVNATDNQGRTALWYAKHQGKKAFVELLLKHGAKE
jgi:ankyrin repeat protein/beta-lactamase regulating signal transducer with metallopeptidase domain